MTQEDVIRMARESGWIIAYTGYQVQNLVLDSLLDRLERFAALVAASEREACAKVCMDMQRGWCSDDHIECATAIRAMKEAIK